MYASHHLFGNGNREGGEHGTYLYTNLLSNLGVAMEVEIVKSTNLHDTTSMAGFC